MPSCARDKRGFTLVEMVIVIAIIGLLTGVVAPALGALGQLRLQKSARMLSVLIQQSYERAILTGQTHRILYSSESKQIVVEESPELLRFDPNSNAMVEAQKVSSNIGSSLQSLMTQSGLGEFEAEPQTEIDPSALDALFNIGSIGEQRDLKSFTKTDLSLSLEGDVKIAGMATPEDKEMNPEGFVLYFFPHGYTQDAWVYMEDEDDSYTIRVQALTGRATVKEGRVEP